MVKTKGGYKEKNGFYIKGDCKNSEEDGHINTERLILDPVTNEPMPVVLDPLTYEPILEGNIVQLSDDYCYNKSAGLIQSINNRGALPFGNKLMNSDRRKLNLPESYEEYTMNNVFQRPINAQLPPPPPAQFGQPQINDPGPPPPGTGMPGYSQVWSIQNQRWELRRNQAPRSRTNRGGYTKKRKSIKKIKSASKRRKTNKKRKIMTKKNKM